MTNCNRLKMRAADGKRRQADVAYIELYEVKSIRLRELQKVFEGAL